MHILLELTRYEETGQGDIRKLKGSEEFRLRVGDYRVPFDVLEDGRLSILHVFHRKEAYRG
jgi:mRNA interferase RelE/StbE